MRWRVSFKKIAYTVLGLYFLVSCYTGYLLIKRRLTKEKLEFARIRNLADFQDDDHEWNPWGEAFENDDQPQKFEQPQFVLGRERPLGNMRGHQGGFPNLNRSQEFEVEIWGKAAIGLYLWEHILNGELETKLGGAWSYGFKRVGNLKLRFRTGPGVIPSKVPKTVENLILVLNGREPSKIDFAKLWLDHLPTFRQLRNVAVFLLGNEQCDNEWIKPYMEFMGGIVKFVYLVYDSPDIDDVNFYQWPLGVATYRDFPKVDSAHLPIEIHRKYSCNFLGTIYRNSSREKLVETLKEGQYQDMCYVRARYEWLPKESADSRDDYLRALAQSDMTLSPVGQNTECYRIYEAMSYGSIPVVEDAMTPGQCGASKSSANFPLRLLKQYKAPVIYVKNWSELAGLLKNERQLTQQQKAARRREIIRWYENFKSQMRDKFAWTVLERFFKVKR